MVKDKRYVEFKKVSISNLPYLMKDGKHYVQFKELADLFNCSMRTITRIIKSHQHEIIKYGNSWFVLRSDFEKYLKNLPSHERKILDD
jgi:transcriptional antiterminator